jgi:RNA polymerase sigma factor (sigma-70 family)
MTAAYNNISEAQIWDAFRSGDDAAFDHIYNRYGEDLYRYGMHLCGDDSLVKDSLHDLFVRIISNRSGLGPTTSIKYYLLRSLRRQIAKASQKNSTQSTKLLDDDNSHAFRFEQHAELALVKQQTDSALSHTMLQAVNGLPKKQREIVYLIFYCNFSYEQVADTLELTIRTVYNQVYNAVQRLKETSQKFEPFLYA